MAYLTIHFLEYPIPLSSSFTFFRVQWIPTPCFCTGERLLSDSRRCLVKPIVIGCCVGHMARRAWRTLLSRPKGPQPRSRGPEGLRLFFSHEIFTPDFSLLGVLNCSLGVAYIPKLGLAGWKNLQMIWNFRRGIVWECKNYQVCTFRRVSTAICH